MVDTAKGIWHVPFKGRNPSGAWQQNFLWQFDNVYVMDNHRAAMWCWLRSLPRGAKHSIFHIDRHFDTGQARLLEWRKAYPSDWYSLGIDDYLEKLRYQASGAGTSANLPVIEWGNYLAIHLDAFQQDVQTCFFATHGCGQKPNFPTDQTHEVQPWQILQNLGYWLSQAPGPFIMNVDLDYFFCDPEDDGPALQMISDAYIQDVAAIIKKKIDDGTIAATTLCLTPEAGLTGGWASAERIIELMLKTMKIDFRLPG